MEQTLEAPPGATASHCGDDCSLLALTVKTVGDRLTSDERMTMAIHGVQVEKLSQRAAADTYGVAETTLRRKLAEVDEDTAPSGAVSPPEPKAVIGKDGVTRHSPALPETIAKAWAMKDAGLTSNQIATKLSHSLRSVRRWFAKERPEALQAGQPVMATPAPNAEAPALEPQVEATGGDGIAPSEPPNEVKAKKGKLPPIAPHLRNERNVHTPYIRNRLLEAAKLLVEAHSLIKQEQKRLGDRWEKDNLVFTMQYQELVSYWDEAKVFEEFAVVFDDPSVITYDKVLMKLEQIAKRTSQRSDGLRMFTGCRSDNNKLTLAA